MIIKLNRKIYTLVFVVVAVLMVNLARPLVPVIFSEKTDSKSLIILMYHSVLKSADLIGKYTISPDELENDIINLKSAGYEPVSLSEVRDYVNGSSDNFPNKAILITFDDGYYNNYYYAFPLLQKHNMKAVISFIGKMTEQCSAEEHQSPNYSHINYSQITEMYESGYVEFANHSYDMHKITNRRKGSSKSKQESSAQYENVFIDDTRRAEMLLQNKCSITTHIYTYPFGAISSQTDTILEKLGYDITLSSEEGINKICRGMSLYRLKRYNRPGTVCSKDFINKILKL